MSTKDIIQAFSRRRGAESLNKVDGDVVLSLDNYDCNLLLKDNIDSLKENEGHDLSSDLFSYVCALFIGSRGCSKESLQRMGKLFLVSIKLLKRGSFSRQQSAELLELMLSSIRFLEPKQTEPSILAILKDFNSNATEESKANCEAALQLVPHLVARNGDIICRQYAVELICEMKFPVKSVVVLASILVDLCVCEDHLVRAVNKIAAHIVWDRSSLTSAFVDESLKDEIIHVVEPEDLPALVYQLLCLSRKFESSSNNTLIVLSKKVVLESLTEVLDKLFDDACDVMRSLLFDSHPSSNAVDSRIRNILSTIIHHISLLVSKDQGMSNEIVKLLRNNTVFSLKKGDNSKKNSLYPDMKSLPHSSSSQCTKESMDMTASFHIHSATHDSHIAVEKSVPCPSPSRLLLVFLVAKAPRLEDSTVQGFCDCVQVVYSGQTLQYQSLWFENKVWAETTQSDVIIPKTIQHLLEQIISGPFLVESILLPMMKCACALLEFSETGFAGPFLRGLLVLSSGNMSVSSTSYESLYRQNIQRVCSSSLDLPTSPAGMGAWLMIQLFKKCQHASVFVLREVVQKLQMISGEQVLQSKKSMNPLTSNFAMQSPIERLHINLLHHVASSPTCVEEMIDATSVAGASAPGGGSVLHELNELLMLLPSLSPVAAEQLVQAMFPLLQTSPILADRFTLSLRKASFSKDVCSRLSAVSALLSLLQCKLDPKYLRSAVEVHANDFLNENRQSNHAFLSTEEVLALCKRFFCHQPQVRSLLYSRFLNLHGNVPSMRLLTMRLVKNHMLTLVTEDGNESFWKRNVIGFNNCINVKEKSKVSQDLLSVESPRYLLFVNLNACMDAGQYQESMYDLLTTLTSMVIISSEAFISMQSKLARKFSAEQAGETALSQTESGAGVPSTQYGFYTQCDATLPRSSNNGASLSGTSRAERRLENFGKELEESFMALWCLCRGLARGSLQDFGLPPAPSTRLEYEGFVLLVETLQAALNCAALLPCVPSQLQGESNLTGEDDDAPDACSSLRLTSDATSPVLIMHYLTYDCRVSLLQKLSEQLEKCTNIVLDYRKKQKDAEKSANKKKDNPNKTTVNMQTSDQLLLPRLLGAHNGIDTVSCYIFRAELELCTFGLRELFMEAESGSGLRSASNYRFMRKHILERSLYCLEMLLPRLHHRAVSASSDEILELMNSHISNLFQCLMHALIQLRSEDKDHGEDANGHRKSAQTPNNCNNYGGVSMSSVIFPAAVQCSQLYPNQLVLRCLLGCLRAETIYCTGCGQSSYLKGESAVEDTSIDTNSLLLQRLTALLEDGFKAGHSGVLQQNDSSTMLTTGTNYRDETRLQKQAKKFLDLFILMAAPDGTERNESPVVISLLGEVSDALPPARRQALLEIVFRKCEEYLQLPSKAITSALLQLVMYRMPGDRHSRADCVGRVCQLIVSCCADENRFDVDADQDDEADHGDATFTLLTRKTASTAILAVLGILDKACAEMESLLKFSAKQMKSSKAETSLASCSKVVNDLWSQDHNVKGSPDADEIDDYWRNNDEICKALQVCMDLAAQFLSFSSPGAVCCSILSLFLKLFKIQIKLTKAITAAPMSVRSKVSISNKLKSFRDMCLNTATNVAQSLNRYVTEVHNLLDLNNSTKKGSKRNSAHSKLSKLIPDLIYHTEEIDLHIIKLMSGLRERDKGSVSKWLCKVAARDFRLTDARNLASKKRGHSDSHAEEASKKQRENEKPQSS